MIPLVNSENELRASLGLAKVCARCSTEAQSAVIAQYKFSEPEVRGWKASQPAAWFLFCYSHHKNVDSTSSGPTCKHQKG
jgi:hypothetical protein